MRTVLQNLTDPSLLDAANRFVRAVNKADSQRRKSVKETQKTTFAPSKIGSYEGACSRYWYYAFRGGLFTFNPGWRGARFMEGGIDRHARYETAWSLVDENAVIEEEINTEWPHVRGFIDAQVEWEGVKWVVEFKTAGLGAFEKIKGSGRPKPAHLIQILLYMRLKNIRHGMIVYECRDDMRLFAVPIKQGPTLDKYTDYVIEWLNSVYKETKQEEKLPPRCFSEKSWVCKGCPFKTECWDDDRPTESNIRKLKEFKF